MSTYLGPGRPQVGGQTMWETKGEDQGTRGRTPNPSAPPARCDVPIALRAAAWEDDATPSLAPDQARQEPNRAFARFLNLLTEEFVLRGCQIE